MTYHVAPNTQALRGLGGLGALPPGTSSAAQSNARKSYIYLYNLATLAPKLRVMLGVAAGATVASILVGAGGLLVGGAAAAAAAGVVNTAFETTVWALRSKRDRDAYLKDALIEGDTRNLLKKAAARMDTVASSNAVQWRRSLARLYFLDFVAVGSLSALKSLPVDEQTAFAIAYLDCLSNARPEAACVAAGNAAVAKLKSDKLKAAQAAAAAKAKATAIAAAKAKAKATLETAAKAAAIKNLTPVQQSQTQTALKAAEATMAAVVADEKKVAVEVQTVTKAAAEVAAPTVSEVQQAKAEAPAEVVATAAPAEVEGGAVSPAEVKAATTSKAGGFNLLPVIVGVAAAAAGAPALPVVAAGLVLSAVLKKK